MPQSRLQPFGGQFLQNLTIASLLKFLFALALLLAGAVLDRLTTHPPSHPEDCGVMRMLVEYRAALAEGMTDPQQKRALLKRLNEREGFPIADPDLSDLLETAHVVDEHPLRQLEERLIELLKVANARLGFIVSSENLDRLFAEFYRSG